MIGHADWVNLLRDCCTGLMLPCERKSVEPMPAVMAPARTAAQHQSLLHFVGQVDLDREVFRKSPTAIARSLKRSAEDSHRRKSSPYRSAMSMLTFYINRAGKNLSAPRRKKLKDAKDRLREAFGR